MKFEELKEKQQHGTREFPLEVYHPTGLMAPYHWHDEYEFLYMNAGSAYCRMGTEVQKLEAGECVFIKGGMLHSLTVEDNTEFDFFAIVFHPSLIIGDMDGCKQYISSKYVIQNRFSPDQADEVKVIETIKQLKNLYASKPFAYEIRAKALLLQIFSLIFEHALFEVEKNRERRGDTRNLERVISYIHSHSSQSISVEELAAVCGYSSSHFTHYFKEVTGKSPIEYVNRYRIFLACDMLKNTDFNILEVALECGYGNVGYFIRTFKRYLGCTPYQYKKLHFT